MYSEPAFTLIVRVRKVIRPFLCLYFSSMTPHSTSHQDLYHKKSSQKLPMIEHCT